LPRSSTIFRASKWFLRSGIQAPEGGVARYYRSDLERFAPVSTEITGYTISSLLYLHALTGENQYFQPALAAAHFLTRRAWDGVALPFELEPTIEGRLTYFFDCGIVVRGLLSAWQATGDAEFLQTATALGEAMAADFGDRNGVLHPILRLPEKEPLDHDPHRWSRSPGCYQLKAALAWWNLFEATGDAGFRAAYERALSGSLRTYSTFLPGHPDPPKVVDRLHAFLYFLEGLLPSAQEKVCAAALCWGIEHVSRQIEATAELFERCDVYAQLLRLRIYAHQTGAVPLNLAAAQREATILASFQAASSDPRIDGGFFFGRRQGEWLPYINPVSTSFAVQALLLWNQYPNGGLAAQPHLLI
jgi:hypothetical protein